jgi:hypothetical protein
MAVTFGPVTQPANTRWEWYTRVNGGGFMFPIAASPYPYSVFSTYSGNMQAHINDYNPYHHVICDVVNNHSSPVSFYLVVLP